MRARLSQGRVVLKRARIVRPHHLRDEVEYAKNNSPTLYTEAEVVEMKRGVFGSKVDGECFEKLDWRQSVRVIESSLEVAMADLPLKIPLEYGGHWAIDFSSGAA